MTNKKYEDVLKFIKTFQNFDKNGDITNLFTKRYCSIFSHILYSQFSEGEVWWDDERRHSLYKLGEYYFDITGQTFFSGNGHKTKSCNLNFSDMSIKASLVLDNFKEGVK